MPLLTVALLASLVVTQGFLTDGIPTVDARAAAIAVAVGLLLLRAPFLVVVALAAACRSLMTLGMDAVAAHERSLAVRMWTALERVPGLEMLTQWAPGSVDRVGVATFNLDGYRDPLLAAVLSAEHAIGVRHGCFCAHPLLTHLLGVSDTEARRLHAELQAGRDPELPGAVRASLGIGTTAQEVDTLLASLIALQTR